jgi:hypothetical protein
MTHYSTASSADSAATGQPGTSVAMFSQNASIDGTKIAPSQGSQYRPIRVDVTGAYYIPTSSHSDFDKLFMSLLVQQARNVPLYKTTFGRKREYFVTIAYQETSETRRTKGVRIEDQTVVWDEKLDAL